MFAVGISPFQASRRLSFPSYRPCLRSFSLSRLSRRWMAYPLSFLPIHCLSFFVSSGYFQSLSHLPSICSHSNCTIRCPPPSFGPILDSPPPLPSRRDSNGRFLDGIAPVLPIPGVVHVMLSLLLFLPHLLVCRLCSIHFPVGRLIPFFRIHI